MGDISETVERCDAVMGVYLLLKHLSCCHTGKYLLGIWNAGVLVFYICLEFVCWDGPFGSCRDLRIRTWQIRESSSSFRSVSTKFNRRAGPLIHLLLKIYSPPPHPPLCHIDSLRVTDAPLPFGLVRRTAGRRRRRSTASQTRAALPKKSANSAKSQRRGRDPCAAPEAHLPTLGRFPIVTAFVEGLIRILVQRSDRLRYLRR